MLKSVGLNSCVLSDMDLTLSHLVGAKIVVFPHNPTMPKKSVDILDQYVRNGGKLLAFYSVPEGLHPVLGVGSGRHVRETRPGYFASIHVSEQALSGAPTRWASDLGISKPSNRSRSQPGAGRMAGRSGKTHRLSRVVGSSNGLVMTHVLLTDDAANKARLLLAMIGQLAPDLWALAAQASLAQLDVWARPQTLCRRESLLEPLARTNSRAGAALAAAAPRGSGAGVVERQNFAAGMDEAAAAQARLLEAWCLRSNRCLMSSAPFVPQRLRAVRALLGDRHRALGE